MAIKVLVVDDSVFMRKLISDILNEDEILEVVDTAKNGKEALGKIKELSPDVITLDIEMPIMDGITTLKHIVNDFKKPVVMLSSLTKEGAEATLKALEIGAVDFITKPTNIFKVGADEKKKEIIQKVKISSKVKILNGKLNSQHKIIRMNNYKKNRGEFSNLIAIGTSTGGPKALQAIIPHIPKNINGSIVVVQHMPPGFTKSLAKRLDSLSEITVKEAENNERIKKGYCYIAPGDYHMTIDEVNGKELYIRLNKDRPVSGHRPSVDVLMKSVSKVKSMKKIGIILTGMGSDGAKGIKSVKDNNGFTIAQNEETCVVYGMPKSAVEIEGINKILPLEKIAQEIMNRVGV
ncbi:protein-glutamate methylesterase/protein-glutamine glutaminase [Thermohalobacter berrensis]|uniref:Protein-glutamate methylesterase/protein-glutamine glutaminase n=1 Tax=Thermohalobacter berrensis TaxID=99594 RepID=A0A419TAF3_9FIRM|nr:chemotaxis response regulator protein-glutamate methylesterase [Thermohalobacter berrensis]RKD34456.1 chemotaxis response regulator protein-glutamate methylesterase [Thermohalobacter berrensis]